MTERHSTTPWRMKAIREAQEKILALPRPEGCGKRRWRAVQELLLRLAEHLPNIEVSQEKLAAKLMVDERTVRYRVAWAVEIGVLDVTPISTYHGYWDHNHYRLLGISTGGNEDGRTIGNECPSTIGNDCLQRPTYLRYSGSASHSVPSVLSPQKDQSSSPPSGGDKENSMSDVSDLGSGVGDDAMEMTPQAAPSRKRKPARVTQVVTHFQDAWHDYISTPAGKYHSMQVLFDSQAAFQKRVKVDLLERDGRSVEDVCASFDTFLSDLSARVVGLRDGQPVWKLWWSRRAYYLGRVTSPYKVTERPPGGWETEAYRPSVDGSPPQA